MNLNYNHHIISVLVIASILLSCASDPISSPDATTETSLPGTSDVGFPAQISLAALANKKFVNKSPGTSICPFRKDDSAKSQIGFNQLVDQLKNEGTLDRTLPLDEQQRREAFELVKSGQFKRDILSSIEQAYIVNNEPPFNALREIENAPELSQAFARDLSTNPITILSKPLCIVEFTKYIKQRDAPEIKQACRPHFLTNTLTATYQNPTTSRVATTARSFTNKKNRSMRLAIIVYARINGINISDSDLDTMDTFLDTSKNPDLTPLIEDGLQMFADQYGLKDVQAAKDKIKDFDRACSIN